MVREYGTLEAFGVFFACWGMVFFGIWVVPLADVWKILVDIVVTILSVVAGLAYFTYAGTIQWAKHSSFIQKVVFGFAIGFFLSLAVVDFILSAWIWEVFSINGVNVLTYRDMVSIFFAIAGIIMITFVIRVIDDWKLKQDKS